MTQEVEYFFFSLVFFFFFLSEPFLKSFLEFVTILLLLYFYFFGHEACGTLVPQPGIQPTAPSLGGEVLTAEPPGKSH